MVLRVDIGVFAHDEASGIAAMVHRLSSQDLTGLDARILILANGCTDATVPVAQAAAKGTSIEVFDLPEAGKSRTWNSFVHNLSRPDSDVLIFADADIAFPATDTLARLVNALSLRPHLWAMNSQPVKDIVANPVDLGFLDRLISSASGGLDDWKSAICGQLYAMPAASARRFSMPIGLPVEDGFLRAMILTDAMTEDEDLSRIDGQDGIFHIYESERSVMALLRHQVRIVIGSAINGAVFASLRQALPQDRHAILHKSATDSDWLPAVIRQRLPRWPYAYVPSHFLFKRLQRAFTAPRNARRLSVVFLGFAFDSIVYVWAQIRMFAGHGAGFW
jgi:glycosyltransferase involved in cell wall biosynthesis